MPIKKGFIILYKKLKSNDFLTKYDLIISIHQPMMSHWLMYLKVN